MAGVESSNVACYCQRSQLLFDYDAQTMSQATPDEQYHLITRRLDEVLGGETIKALLVQGKTPKCYWGMYHTINLCSKMANRIPGTAPTGRRQLQNTPNARVIVTNSGGI